VGNLLFKQVAEETAAKMQQKV